MNTFSWSWICRVPGTTLFSCVSKLTTDLAAMMLANFCWLDVMWVNHGRIGSTSIFQVWLLPRYTLLVSPFGPMYHLEPIENVKYASGSSCRPLQNGRLGFPLLTQTHDDIAFAVNPLSPPHFCRWFLCAGASWSEFWGNGCYLGFSVGFLLGSWVGKLWVSTCLWFVICSVVGVLVGFLQDVALF
jgi:hypothetical protein